MNFERVVRLTVVKKNNCLMKLCWKTTGSVLFVFLVLWIVFGNTQNTKYIRNDSQDDRQRFISIPNFILVLSCKDKFQLDICISNQILFRFKSTLQIIWLFQIRFQIFQHSIIPHISRNFKCYLKYFKYISKIFFSNVGNVNISSFAEFRGISLYVNY